MSILRDEIAAVARARSEAYLAEMAAPIAVNVAGCGSYSALLRGVHEEATGLGAVLGWASQSGRVILAGRGASGKTTLLHRLVLLAVEGGQAPFFIDLSQWDHAASDSWIEISDSPRDAMDFLLRRFGPSKHDLADAEFLPSSVGRVFLLDGLNETPGSTADSILAACDRIASLLVNCSVIVTDRLVRRQLDNEGKWRFSMPLPVEKPEQDRLLKGLQIPLGAEPLLSIPFFLDRAMRGELRASPLETIRELVEDRGGVNDDGLRVIGRVAFNAYEIDRSRSFDMARFAELGGGAAAGMLMASGLLVRLADDRVAFLHHWVHDYLAAKYVAETPELWSFEHRHRVLDILTFKANSFDAIAFALELAPLDDRDSFLRAVYDWNPYAAGYALAEARGVGIEDVPRHVRLIILAMLAEKRFDRHFHSARRASDALDLFSDDDSISLRNAATHDALIEFVAGILPDSERFAVWQECFTMRKGDPAPKKFLEALDDADSVVGWTAANVLKRLSLSGAQKKEIVRLAMQDRAVIRWRACHVMGGFIDGLFNDALLDRLKHDADESVRYGAIRSLVEAASLDEGRVPQAADQIIESLGCIETSPKVLGELSRAVFLSAGYAPANWAGEISRVFYALLERTEDVVEVERWSKVASRLRIHHRHDESLAA